MIKSTDPSLTEKVHPNKDSVYPKDNEEPKTVKAELIAALRKDPFSDTIRVVYDEGARSMHPRDLFKEPTNKHYHRSQPLDSTMNDTRKSHEVTLLISGKVHLIK